MKRIVAVQVSRMRKKARHHRVPVPQRPPSPIRPSPNKQTLTYAQAQRMVDMEIDGRVHRISIYDKLDVISDDDPMAQEIMECTSNKENMEKPQQTLMRSVRLKNSQEKRSAATVAQNHTTHGATAAQAAPAQTLPEAKLRTVEYNLPAVPRRPPVYYKYVEKTSEELDEEVEYDMDEEDYAWLEVVNNKRRSEGVSQVSHNVFEFLVDRFEKETQMEKEGQDKLTIDEDAVCCICMDGDGQDSNVILFCDMCNLAVHQECYGVPYIPEGQWLCRHCLQLPTQPAGCILCPNKGGAVKKTDDDRWGHVVCALWVPEVGFSNTVFIEPIDGVSNIPSARWKLTCYLCKEKGVGACIQCHKANCYTAFHVSCAQKAGLFMKMEPIKEVTETGEPTFSVKKTAYCGSHTPNSSVKRPLTIYEDTKPQNGLCSPLKGEKWRGAKALMKGRKMKSKKVETEKEVPPVAVPSFPPQRLNTILNRVSMQKKKAFVELALNYWTLKRQARNGVPLIRRLQSSQQSHQKTHAALPKESEEESRALKEQLKEWHRLRLDLERARLLLELIRKREKLKREEMKLQQSLLEVQLTPFSILLRSVLEQLQERDQSNIFAHPVDIKEVPDYLDHIRNPMDFATMRKRIDDQAYSNLNDFESDFNLIIFNCMKYNCKDTFFHRAAARLRDQGGALIRKTQKDVERIGFEKDGGMHLSEPPKIEAPPRFSWEDVDHLLVPANRQHMPLEEQLKELLEKLDMTYCMKSSPSRSKRLKLLKKTINNVRSEMSLSLRRASHHSHLYLSSSHWSSHPERSKAGEADGVKTNGQSPDNKGDKSLPPKLEPSDSLPTFLHFESNPEPPTLKPIHPNPTPDSKTHGQVKFDREKPNNTFSTTTKTLLNGHSESQNPLLLLEGGVSVVATSTLAQPSGTTVSRRTAVLFRKSKTSSPGKNQGGRGGGKAQTGCPQLGTKTFLSVMIPRLETLLHPRTRKRSHSPSVGISEGGGDGEDESPVKHIDTGLSNGFVMEEVIDEEKELSASRPLETRRRCASESSISTSGSLLGSTRRQSDSVWMPIPDFSSTLSLPTCGKGKPALVRRNTVDDKNELIACIETGNFARAARIAAEVGNNNIWMPASAATVVLEPLKLVWAKCSGYPSYPALIVDPHMPRMACQHNGVSIPMPPLDVLRVGERMQYKNEEKLFLVLFFDNKRSWQWLPKFKMVPLGIDKTIDKIKMMEGRSSSIRKAVQTAYERAMNHLSIVQDEPVSDMSDVD
ncbi:bromodomain-containing protein 1-like isoform X4 [Salvelinus fontinalis]|uniref:bromodomain-containing protein 1-like isoform X4 n=1 Tax=Salvelinus fontinalis TaxID=8038 RepID=UPI002485FF76|nr:bromodomain-containing protein 1-like isoform X4 [Salvelinus fontinalis]